MTNSDFEGFALALRRTFLACTAGQKEPDPDTVGLYFDLFMHLPLEEVLACLKAHMLDPERGKFVPRPGDITHQLQLRDGHPDPDSAWAVAVKAADEEATVIWTTPISEAWEVARGLYSSNKVGAAMAFKAAYTKLLAAERSQGRRAAWHPSLGFNKQLATEALRVAVSSGTINQASLPNEAQLLLEGKPLSLKPPEWLRDKWDSLYTKLTSRPNPGPTDRERTLELKGEAAKLYREAKEAQ